MIKQVLYETGGSCHIETILETIRQSWGFDGEFNAVECRRSLLTQLRSPTFMVCFVF